MSLAIQTRTSRPTSQPTVGKPVTKTAPQTKPAQLRLPGAPPQLTQAQILQMLDGTRTLQGAPTTPTTPATQTDLLRGAAANPPEAPKLLQTVGGAYGSNPNASLIPVNDKKHTFITSSIPTPAEVGEMYKGHVGNMFNPAWARQVQSAIQQNGGLGNPQDGYLGFSFNHGFVRLKNPNLSDEQNRRFAEMSLVTGAGVERLPSRSKDDAVEKPKVGEWADKFIKDYDTKMQTFLTDPAQGLSLKDGRLRFNLSVDAQSGTVVSNHFRKAGGFRGFLQGAMKYIGPVADIASVVFPGVGSAIAQAVKFACGAIARGKLMVSDVVGAVSGFVPMIGKGLGFAMNRATTALTNGVLGSGAMLIDSKGKVGLGALLSTVGGAVTSTGNASVDSLLQSGLGIAGKVIDKNKLTSEDLLGVISPLSQLLGGVPTADAVNAGKTNGLPNWGNQLLSRLGVNLSAGQIDLIKNLGAGVFTAVRDGKITGENLASVLGGYVSQTITQDENAQLQLYAVMKQLGAAIDAKQTSPDRLLQALANGLHQAQNEIEKRAGN